MGKISLESVVQACLRQVSAELGGETVVLSFDNGMYYSVNEVGARIWSLVQDAARVADVMAALLAEYDVPADRCEADLLALLGELEQLQLIEIRDADGG